MHELSFFFFLMQAIKYMHNNKFCSHFYKVVEAKNYFMDLLPVQLTILCSFLFQVVEWLCDNMNAFESFDQTQEFILGQSAWASWVWLILPFRVLLLHSLQFLFLLLFQSMTTRVLTSSLHKAEFFHQLCLTLKFLLATLCQAAHTNRGI